MNQKFVHACTNYDMSKSRLYRLWLY